jgi:hypothetical protein
MSTVRIQVRRGTADQWSDVNPILAAGEMGLESDTNFIKFGNGTSHWDDLPYANDPTSFDLANTLADYVLVSDVGNAGGPAKLDADGNLLIPKASIIIEGSSADDYETTLTVANPTADRTITFPNATGTVALTSDIAEFSQDAINSALNTGSGITKDYNDESNTLTLSIDTGVIATTEALRSVVASLNIHSAAMVATTENLVATYTAGTADNANGYGIGAKLTMTANGALQIDGYSLEQNDRVLVKNQTNAIHNGIYRVSVVGTSSTRAELVRAEDYNNSDYAIPADASKGDVIFISAGNTNALKQFSQVNAGTNTDESIKIGVEEIAFTQISGTATVINGNGISKNGDTLSLDTSVTDAIYLKQTDASSTYLTQSNAGSTYLSKTDAGNTYLTQTNATGTYLTQSNAATTYLTQTNAATTYLNKTDAGTNYFAKNTDQIADANIKTNAAITANKIAGTAVTQADTGTVTNTMLAGSIANNKLTNSTISGKSLGTNLDTLTIGTGLSGTSYNGGSAVTVAVDSTIATKTYADNAVSTHEADTTSVHGIADTSALATKTYADNAVSTHEADTTNVHGITNTADLLLKSGGTMTGALTLSGAPTSDLHAATKLYVDGLAAGINFHQPVVAATAGNLAGTYNNGTDGYLATLTKASNGSIGTIDGATVAVGNRILLCAQTDAKQNGIYVITALGDGSNPWVITRAADNDNNPVGELASGDFCFVTSGSTNGSKGFIVSTTGTITIGTTEINYAQFNASEAIIAGTNISKNGATISVVSTPTLSGVTFSDGTQTKEGVPSRTPIISKIASYTLTSLTERDSLIEVNSTSPVTITIPTNEAVAYPIGTTLDILGVDTGLITIAGDTGVTVNATPGLKLRTQWSSCTLFKRDTNSWVVYGDLKS